MINRLLIRIKTVQLVYAYMQGSMDRLNSDDELANSLESSYKLYNYLLGLIVKITDYRKEQIETGKKKFMPTEEERRPNTRFIDNRIAAFIREKSEILQYCEEHDLYSDFDTETYRQLLEQIEQLPVYQQYMTQPTLPTFEEDRNLWKEIFNQVINTSEKLDATLEEKSIYWNDDLTTVTTFVIKALNKIKEKAETMSLAKMFDSEEDRQFAVQLFHYSMDEASENETIIGRTASNWQIDRMALMDKVIMICALSEIRHFADIPTRISLNEYIELAKHYCAKDTARFVNGLLDKIVKQWKQEGVIFKA